MSTTIDARGLSCPQPVLMFMGAVNSSADKEIIVLVDTNASMENVTRAAQSKDCKVTVTQEADQYRLTIVRN